MILPRHFDFLQKALIKNNFIVSLNIQEAFLQYLYLMQRWNHVYNLTAILDIEEMIMLHIIDSLSISPYLHGNRIIDIGTGAGLPGIPLALIHPEKHITLLDSNNKKTRFLTQVVIELKIKNIDIISSRCENFHPEQRFDSILSRAFASLKVMLLTTQHLLKEHGQFLAMKGSYPEQELLDIPSGFKMSAIQPLHINGLEAERHLICLERETS
ncbi:MAG: 16S rRNA (guanine(527)-N(7))-methyltransferase RsmG, partial [Gammaproteobacteria bacterium]|nr:16S rRNA (guanine(527)-N(7))-methyltransferase RsmG [Gammaproteobacteria bacterium]